MSYPAVLPHDPIEQIETDLFMARGSVKLNPILRITRNMAIVRNDGELTLVNPVRLSDSELTKLDELGTVKHVLRTGPFHGMDDPFYMNRYQARFWCQEGGTTYKEPAIDEVLTEGGALPFPNAQLFCFRTTIQPESVLVVNGGAGTLLPCDSIQHYDNYSNCNLPARLMMPRIGFPRTTLLGPFWLKLMTPKGQSLSAEFQRFLAADFEFDKLLSAHGTLRTGGANAAVRTAIIKVYPELG